MDIEELKAAMEDDEGVKTFIDGLVNSAVGEATVGLKTANKDLKNEKVKMQKVLDGMPSKEDLENFKNLSKIVETSEDAKLIAEGKFDEVIDRRTERVRLNYESKEKEIAEELNKTKGQLNEVNSAYDNHRINESIRAEALKQGMAPEALNDAVLRATNLFSIVDGKIVSLDSEGHVNTNDKNVPLDVKVFVTDLKESAPHFWPGSKGAGLGGSVDGAGDALVIAAEKGETATFVDQRRAQKKKRREAHLS